MSREGEKLRIEDNGTCLRIVFDYKRPERCRTAPSRAHTPNVRNVLLCSGHAADCLRVSPDVRVRKTLIGWLKLRSH
jgi:hypothetical protein